MVNRLRVGFSQLQKHKFRHNFANTLNPLCACALETECTKHFVSTLPELYLIPNDLYERVR